MKLKNIIMIILLLALTYLFISKIRFPLLIKQGFKVELEDNSNGPTNLIITFKEKMQNVQFVVELYNEDGLVCTDGTWGHSANKDDFITFNCTYIPSQKKVNSYLIKEVSGDFVDHILVTTEQLYYAYYLFALLGITYVAVMMIFLEDIIIKIKHKNKDNNKNIQIHID